MYTCGWIKRGASGVLGSNKPDAKETIDCLIEDVANMTPCLYRTRDQWIAFLNQKNIQFVTYSDWQRLDQEELRRGQEAGKPREKFTKIDDMLSFINKTKTSNS